MGNIDIFNFVPFKKHCFQEKYQFIFQSKKEGKKESSFHTNIHYFLEKNASKVVLCPNLLWKANNKDEIILSRGFEKNRKFNLILRVRFD